MIFTERTIMVVNDSATINKPLILYRGDKNIELKITIAESQFKFRSTGASNVIETTDASYAQLVINTPYNSPIFSEVTATENGTVIFVISAAMIDEIREVGVYDIQIRLLDDNKQSRVTIPPVSNAIEIREPMAIEDGSVVDSNVVNVAKVNRALTTTSAPLEVFDSQGNYIKNNWGDGVLITDAALNKMEAGIEGVNNKVANIADKAEMIPIKNTHYIMRDCVPVSRQNINISEMETEGYIFNDEQITLPDELVLGNFKDKFSAIAFHSTGLLNAVISYNDGTNDITKEIELTISDDESRFFYAEYSNSVEFVIGFGFDYSINKFGIYAYYWPEDVEAPAFYEIKNVTISYNYYTNLMRDKYIADIDYSKIINIPYQLNYLVDGMTMTLPTEEYVKLFDNLFIWDANKINDRLDSTSGVKQNVYYNHKIQIKQKDGEGIGFGQYIPFSTMDKYKLFVSAGKDVIVKVYNRKQKTLISEISDFIGEKYKEVTISDTYPETDGIFIAFTVKDSTKNFYGNTYVSDLILCKSNSLLTKQEVNEKVDKSQLSFNSNGELVVTIDGISKTFVPKTE